MGGKGDENVFPAAEWFSYKKQLPAPESRRR